MKSKEEILHGLIDNKWPIGKKKHIDIRNRLAKLSSWGIEEQAMDEYAKQEAIAFWDFCVSYHAKISNIFSMPNAEQLYDLYLESKKQKV